MNNESYVPLSEVMKALVNLCPECRGRVKARLDSVKQTTDPVDQTMLNIIEEVSQQTGLPMNILRGKSHRPPVVSARRIIAERARAIGYSFPQIGDALGKHHTTIMHLLRTHAQNQNTDRRSEVPSASALDSAAR